MSAAAVVSFDPLREKRYRETALGRDVVDFLAWGELGGWSEHTRDQYERDPSRGCLMFPSNGIAELEDGDAIQIAKFKPGERRVRVAAWRSFYKWGLRSRRCERNPFDALPTIKRTPRRVYDLFTDPEIAALCGLEIRDGALMQILYDAGPRKGDCRAFQLQHFRAEPTPDAPYGRLVFKEGKGGKDQAGAGDTGGSGEAERARDPRRAEPRRLPLVRQARQRGRLPNHALGADRRRHLRPVVAALPGRSWCSLPQPAHNPAHLRHPLPTRARRQAGKVGDAATRPRP
jgi:hypothetical protein